MSQFAGFEVRVNNSIHACIAVKQPPLLDPTLISSLVQVSAMCLNALKGGKQLLLFGNGGSAADAQHLAANFVGRFVFDRPALPALALSVNSSCLTAIGNYYGFDRVFSRQLEARDRQRDVAVGFSTSGISQNAPRGISTAKKMGLPSIALTGNPDRKLSHARTRAFGFMLLAARLPAFRSATLDHMVSESVEQELSMLKAAFLDRDGVINRKAPEGQYITRWEDVEFLPRVADAITLLNQARFSVIVVNRIPGSFARLHPCYLLLPPRHYARLHLQETSARHAFPGCP
jgi:D-sedoheptulose 7-phosphate isomerase